MPAMLTLTRALWGRTLRDRLAALGTIPMVILDAMMRKLIHVAFGVLKSNHPFNPALHGALRQYNSTHACIGLLNFNSIVRSPLESD